MVKNSTLFYLVDEFNHPSEMILAPENDHSYHDESLDFLLDFIEIDPGDDLVARTIQRVKQTEKPLP